ncbi:hypothetical protein EF888_12995 [Silicimonas algicola]|uniref:Gluconate 2-dehydrogenase alpha chain n=1 Tax=Silicimonas algicola TaxID=1826607 RepID=A0A316GDY3_9RHOB|nr:GMC family oxidoreductase [Silicimonas algicola]AZQ67969.1 hypothetical protein EF888_12995 [Silicimonas algicola]PWK57590.1 gluconate 2-dehydrogenase alpha chain [Silicimonas algicola]
MTPLPDVTPAEGYATLGPGEAAILSAAVAVMWPADAAGPDGAALGVVRYVDRALAGAEQAARSTYTECLAALDHVAVSAHGSRFAELPADAQVTLLERLSRGELGIDAQRETSFFSILRRHLTEGLFADPVHGGNLDCGGWRSIGFPGVVLSHTAEDNLGASTDPGEGPIPSLKDVIGEPAPRAAPPKTSAENIDAADVVIVGGGGVGALVGPWLVQAGLKVVILEAGEHRKSDRKRPDELTYAYYCRAGFGEKFNSEVPTWCDGEGADPVPMPFSLGRMCNGVGGSLVHYGARLRRMHPHQFRMRSTLSDLGRLEGLDDDCTVADWPLDYDALEPHYEALEQLVGIAGADTHPFIPRRTGLPMPPAREFAVGAFFEKFARGRGLHPEPVPVGQNTVPYAGRPAMEYSPWGEGTGCPGAARWMPNDDLLPAALATGGLGLRTGARVLRIRTDSSGRASGVDFVDAQGRERIQVARAVILSAYTFENVRLMYLSGDSAHPDGLGNSSDQLGRHFMTKQFPSVYGSYPGQQFNRHTGPGAQGLVIEDFLTSDFLAASGLAGGGTLSVENQLLPIQIAREPLPPDTPNWGTEWKAHVRAWNERLAIRIQTDTLPYRDNRLTLDPLRHDTSGLGLPVVRATYRIRGHENRLYQRMIFEAEDLHRGLGAARVWPGPVFTGIGSCHDLGGCRMGEDPDVTVVSPDLEVHDTPGLYVMGGAVFPSCHAVNPTLTIWALCRMASQNLARRLT